MSFEWKFYNLVEKRALGSFEIIQKKVLPCPFCRGKGDVYGGICPVCSGKGKKNVHPPLLQCCRCMGWGSYPMNSQSPCTTCKGIGAVSIKLPIASCSACHGRGDTTSGLACTRCSGKGVVTSFGKESHDKNQAVLSSQTILIKKIGK